MSDMILTARNVVYDTCASPHFEAHLTYHRYSIKLVSSARIIRFSFDTVAILPAVCIKHCN